MSGLNYIQSEYLRAIDALISEQDAKIALLQESVETYKNANHKICDLQEYVKQLREMRDKIKEQ